MNRFVCLLLILFAAGLALTGSARAEQDSRSFTECTNCPMMVGIPAGRFVMGSPKSEPGRFDAEGPQHIVSVGAFALGKYDVTSEQFQIFLEETGYQPEPCNKITGMKWHTPRKGFAYPPEEVEPPKWPAVCLDWKDAQAYIAWLNARVRKEHPSIAYKLDGPYRLPSEAEW